MSGTTTVHALPYPTGTDPVGSGDDVIQALAERLDARIPRAGRSGPHNVASVDTSYSVAIAFPDPFPAGVVPVVQVTAEVAAPTAIVTASGVSNTGFTLNYRRVSGTVNVSVGWTAVVES